MLQDDRAQASTEYILMLAIVVSLFLLAMKNLIQPAFQALKQGVGNQINRVLFNGDMHSIRLGP